MGTMTRIPARGVGTPRVSRIPAGCSPCKCNGTGRFYSGGAVVNGTFTGTIGTCYGCQGKGYQTKADVARCRTYWRFNMPRR